MKSVARIVAFLFFGTREQRKGRIRLKLLSISLFQKILCRRCRKCRKCRHFFSTDPLAPVFVIVHCPHLVGSESFLRSARMIHNLIANRRTKQINHAMKVFKTVEELMDYIAHQENLEILESGEVVLKEWNEDAKALEKFKKDHGLAANDRKSLRGKNEELTKKVTELTEQLASVNNELTGLKEVHSGGDKDAVQKLIKEKSELQTKYNAVEAEYREMKITIPELEKRIETYKEASHRSLILDAARKAAVQRKVPQNIIDDPDFETIVVSAFTVDDVGNIFTKGDTPQNVDNYIAAKQKDRTHWMPLSQGGSGNDPLRPSNSDIMVSDEQAAIAALFG